MIIESHLPTINDENFDKLRQVTFWFASYSACVMGTMDLAEEAAATAEELDDDVGVAFVASNKAEGITGPITKSLEAASEEGMVDFRAFCEMIAKELN